MKSRIKPFLGFWPNCLPLIVFLSLLACGLFPNNALADTVAGKVLIDLSHDPLFLGNMQDPPSNAKPGPPLEGLEPEECFASLISLLEQMGFEVVIADDLANLAEYVAVIETLPREYFLSDEVQSLQFYLDGGGILVLLGDYGSSDVLWTNDPLNQLLLNLDAGVQIREELVIEPESFDHREDSPLVESFSDHCLSECLTAIVPPRTCHLELEEGMSGLFFSTAEAFVEQSPETKGPFVLASIASNSRHPDWKLLVLPDSTLFSQDYTGADNLQSFDNRRFAQNIFTWCAVEEACESDTEDGSEVGAQGCELRINTYTDNTQGFPSSVFLKGGSFFVVWQSNNQDGDERGVFGRTYNSIGIPNGDDFQVNLISENDQITPIVRSGPDDRALVVWKSHHDKTIFHSSCGRWISELGVLQEDQFTIMEFDKPDAFISDIALASDGSIVALVQEPMEETGTDLFLQRIAQNGKPIGSPVQVLEDMIGNQQTGRIAPTKDGGVVVSWTTDSHENLPSASLWRLFDSNLEPMGKAQLVEFGQGYYPNGIRLLPRSDQGFVLTWGYQNPETDLFSAYYRLYGPDQIPIGPAKMAESDSTASSFAPASAAHFSGKFVLVWEYEGGQLWESGIRGRAFLVDGTPLGPAFPINSLTEGPQYVPDVAVDLAGNFLVSWETQFSEDSGFDIAAQRFEPDGQPKCVDGEDEEDSEDDADENYWPEGDISGACSCNS
jgi:hypothetical protein